MLRALIFTAVLAGPPAGDRPAEVPDPTEPAATEPAATDPYVSQAPLDVETILQDDGRAYLDAWGRLEQHPALAAEAILDRLAAIPALGPAERKRLLDILAGLQRPEHVPLFAQELRRAVVQADDDAAAERAAERWRVLLRDQGAAAMPHLLALVGDRELPIAVRSTLIEDLVMVTPVDRAAELVVLLGRGHPRLRRSLRAALVARAKRDPAAATALRGQTDDALQQVLEGEDVAVRGSSRATALVWFRAHVTEPADGAFIERMTALASDDEEAFALRVAAVRALGRLRSRPASTALGVIATEQLSTTKRATQRGEVLGWVAVRQLPADAAAPVVDALQLRSESAPRLAEVAYELGTLPPSGPWLSEGLANPWPSVRQAALSRLRPPCTEADLDRLAELGGPPERGGERDGAVARAATQALGRCGSERAHTLLVRQLKQDAVPLEQRAEAGRQLVKHGGTQGLDAVARVLDRDDITRPLARRLSASLRFAPEPTERATRVLCNRLGDGGEIAQAAAETLRTWYRGTDESPCER